MSNTKRCPDCLQDKSLNNFHNNKRTKDGKASYCKICLLQRSAAYRANNPEKVKLTNKQSKKRNYAKAKETRNRYESANRDLVNARKRSWNSRNKNKVHAMNQNSYRKNPSLFIENRRRRYAQLKKVDTFLVTAQDYARLRRQACVYCQSKMQIEIDHIHPIAKNGRHSVGNLVPACRTCNRSKKDLFVMEWKLRQKKN